MTPPGAARGTTHHLLQLLSLTTIFEFDGLSNYIPPLPCQPGGFAQLQIRLPMLQRPQTVVALPKVPLVHKTIDYFFFFLNGHPKGRGGCEVGHFTALSVWVYPKRESQTLMHSCVFHSSRPPPRGRPDTRDDFDSLLCLICSPLSRPIESASRALLAKP